MARHPHLAELPSDAVAIIGLGRFGQAMALELMHIGTDVLGIDTNADIVNSLNGKVTQVAVADATSDEAISQLAIPEFQKVVVAIGSNIETSILVVSRLLKAGVKNVWAKAHTEAHREILEMMGVTHVFQPDIDQGKRAAHMVNRTMRDYYSLGHGFAMATIVAPRRMCGVPLQDTGIRSREGVTVVGIESDEHGWASATGASVVQPGSVVLVVGPDAAIERICQEAQSGPLN